MTSKSKTSKTSKATTEATTEATATVSSNLGACREAMESACKSFEKIAETAASLNEKRAGSYSLMVAAAIVAGSLEAFTDVYAGLKSDISGNVAGIARKLGCKAGKPTKDGKPSGFVVSGSMMNAVSVLKAAMEYKIELTEKGEPRAYGAIRKAKELADAKAREATETPLAAAQRTVRELAAKIAEGADALTVTEAQDCAKILRNLIAVETGATAKAA